MSFNAHILRFLTAVINLINLFYHLNMGLCYLIWTSFLLHIYLGPLQNVVMLIDSYLAISEFKFLLE